MAQGRTALHPERTPLVDPVVTHDDIDPLCEKACAYGECGGTRTGGGSATGCGGCCGCLGGCQVAYENTLPQPGLDALLDALHSYARAGHAGCVWDLGPCNLDDLPASAARAAGANDLAAYAHQWVPRLPGHAR